MAFHDKIGLLEGCSEVLEYKPPTMAITVRKEMKDLRKTLMELHE